MEIIACLSDKNCYKEVKELQGEENIDTRNKLWTYFIKYYKYSIRRLINIHVLGPYIRFSLAST